MTVEQLESTKKETEAGLNQAMAQLTECQQRMAFWQNRLAELRGRMQLLTELTSPAAPLPEDVPHGNA